MSLLHSLVVVVLTVLATAAPTTASNVLTPQNFKQTTAQGVWFVEYFSPYCPHCRHFEPTWNQVIDHFDRLPDVGVRLAQVNCALNGDLCSENGVTGYPQMNLYRDGKFVTTYDADREFYLLVAFLEKHAEPKPSMKKTEDVSTAAPASTAQEAVSSPSPSPAADRPIVVQSPRADANPSGTVVSLNVQNFDSFLAQGPAFIKFFAPWCGHCKKLAPAWAQLGRRMQHKLNVAEVDCEQHKALCTSQGVAGFPTMFYYAHGTKTDYTGGRSYDQLVSFAIKASNPTMQVIDAPELDGVARDNAVFYLLLHDASDDRVVSDVAKGAQLLLGSPPVYVSTSSELAHKYSTHLPSKTPALLAFKDGDAREPVAVYAPSSSRSSSTTAWSIQPSDPLYTWLHAHRFPSSLELSKEAFQSVMNAPHRPLVVVVGTPENRRASVSTKLDEIAKKWRLKVRAAHHAGAGAGQGQGREVVFTWMDAGQWAKWMKDMYGIKVGTEPVVVVADHEHLVYYDKDASGHAIQLNAISVASALDAVLAGKARAKHSRSVLERGVYSLNAGVIWLEGAVARHPYWTGLVVLAFVGGLVMAIRHALRDDPADWASEKRYAKHDRLD